MVRHPHQYPLFQLAVGEFREEAPHLPLIRRLSMSMVSFFFFFGLLLCCWQYVFVGCVRSPTLYLNAINVEQSRIRAAAMMVRNRLPADTGTRLYTH